VRSNTRDLIIFGILVFMLCGALYLDIRNRNDCRAAGGHVISRFIAGMGRPVCVRPGYPDQVM
jgi:hypothetical protein